MQRYALLILTTIRNRGDAYKQYHVFFAIDPSLGNQAIISYAAYNMTNNLNKDETTK